MNRTMTIHTAIEVACKTLMATGNYTQDDRAAAYDVLATHNAHLLRMTQATQGVVVEAATPKTVFSTMEPRPIKQGSGSIAQSANNVLSVEPEEPPFVATHKYIGGQKRLKDKHVTLTKVGLNFVGTDRYGCTVTASKRFFQELPKPKVTINDRETGRKVCTDDVNVLVLSGATPIMNSHGFNDGMKFEFAQNEGFDMVRVRHIRTGKMARLHVKYLKSIFISKHDYELLAKKRNAKFAEMALSKSFDF